MTKPAWFMWSILICGTVVARAEPPVLSLETIFHPKKAVDFDGPALPHTQWLPDGRLAIREGKQWQVLEPQTGEQKAWELPDQLATALKDLPDVNDETIERAVSSLSTTSDDGKRFLVRLGKGLAMYDLETKAAKWLNKNASEWPLAKLSPDGSKIGFSRDGNLFVYDINAGTTTQLTQDGSDQLLNGQLDWVYQEEVYGRGQFRSFWFSPDSKRIAYLKLDQSPVPTWILDNTTTKRQSLEHTRYPRSGDPIPSVQLWVSQVDSLRSAVRVDEPSEPEMLIVRVTWRPNGELYYQVQDRRQRWLELYRYSVGKKTNTRVLREDTGAWQEPLLEPLWQADGSFLWMSDRADGYRHLYRVDARGQLTALTRGAWNVWQLESVAEKEPYAIVTGSDQAGERAAYRIRTDRFEEPFV